MLAGLLAGLLEDLVSVPGRLLGLHAFTKVLIGYLLATIAARTVIEKPAAVGGLLAGAVLTESLAARSPPLDPPRRGARPVAAPRPRARRRDRTRSPARSRRPRAYPWRERRAARRRMRLG